MLTKQQALSYEVNEYKIEIYHPNWAGKINLQEKWINYKSNVIKIVLQVGIFQEE